MKRTCDKAPAAFLCSLWPGILIALPLSLMNGCSLMQGRSTGDMVVPSSDPSIQVHADFALPDDRQLREALLALRGQISTDLLLQADSPPIHVHLFATEARYREFMNRRFPSFPDRRAYFVEDAHQFAVYAQWSNEMDVDLRHELTHAYLHSATKRIPLWMDEGLAEHYEVPPADGGLNRQHLSDLVRDAKLGRWSPNLPRLEQLHAVEQMSQQDYAESWCWVHWLMNDAGRGTNLLRAYLAGQCTRPSPEPFSRLLFAEVPDANEQVLNHLSQLHKLH